MKNIFLKYDWFIILVAFLIAYLPYFFFAPLPNVDPDGFKYFKYALDLKESFFVDFSAIPPLLPIFLSITSSLPLNMVIFIQIAFHFGAFLFLYVTLKKYFFNHRFLILAILFLSVFDNYSLFYNTGIFPDSLYGSLIIIFAALMLIVLNEQKGLIMLLLSITVFSIALTRSNGIVFLVFPFLIAIFSVLIKKNNYKSAIKYTLLPFVCFILSWSLYNYSSYGRFFPGNTYRTGVVVKKIIDNTEKEIQEGVLLDFDQHKYGKAQETFTKTNVSRSQMFLNYLYLPSDTRNSFYNYSVPNRYYYYFKNNELGSDSLLLGSESYENDTVRQGLYREYFPPTKVEISNVLIGELEMKNNPFIIKSYNFFYWIFDHTIASVIWLALFLVSLLAILVFFFNPIIRKQSNYFYIVLLICVYLGNILVISVGHSRYVARYLSSIELIYFIIPVLTAIFTMDTFNKKNHDKQ